MAGGRITASYIAVQDSIPAGQIPFQNISGLNHKFLHLAYLVKTYVLLVAILPSDKNFNLAAFCSFSIILGLCQYQISLSSFLASLLSLLHYTISGTHTHTHLLLELNGYTLPFNVARISGSKMEMYYTFIPIRNKAGTK